MRNIYTIFILLHLWLISVVEGRPNSELNERFANSKMRDNNKGFNTKFLKKRSIDPTTVNELRTTETSTTSEVHMDINEDRLSDFLRCSECLTDCKESRNSLSYYFCASCIRNCNGNVDAFMHFFSTHQCTVSHGPSMTQPDINNFPSTPTKEVTYPQGEDIATEYLNREFNQGNEESKCPNLYQKHAQCTRDLEICTAENKKGNLVHYRSAQPVVKGEENNPPTEPAVDLAPTTPQNPSQLDPEYSFQDLFPSFIKSNTMNPTVAKPGWLESSKVVEQFKSRFVTRQEFYELSRRTWNTKPEDIATLKSTPSEEIEPESRRPICPTTFRLTTRHRATHYLGKFDVEIFVADGHVQFFFLGVCTFNKPRINIGTNAVCQEVSNLQRAVFLISKKIALNPNYKVANCKPHDGERHVCDDWVVLPGACSVFL